MTLRPAAVLSALALLAGGLTVLTTPDVADAAGAGDTVFIDDPLQAESLGAAWTVAGSRWTPELRTVAENNTIIHSENTKDCSPWPTCLATYDSVRDGNWLTLTSDNTRNGEGESGFVLHKTPFSSARGVVIEYDQRVYRTNNGKYEVYQDGTESMVQGGGDGISLFLVDANAPDYGRPDEIDKVIAQPGGYGAGLGYSSVSQNGRSWCPAQPGIAGAYLGIGFDVFGNYQKAETSIGAGNPGTRPKSVSGNNPAAENARLPQSIGLRGSGVRFRNVTTCAVGDQDSLDRNYGMIRFPEVNNPGYVTFYSAIWDAGTSASDYRFQYRTPDGVWHSWYDMEPSTRGGTTSGYMQARVPTTALPVTFAIQKKSDTSRYSETANLSQDAIVAGANRTLLETRQGGYRWLAGTGSNGSTTTGAWIDNAKDDARQYRRVRVTLTPKADGSREVVVSWSPKLNVANDVCVNPTTKLPNGLVGSACDGTAGEWRPGTAPTFTEQFRYDLSDSQYQAAMPSQFRLGFAASTGWAVNYHQIRNLRVTSPTDIAVTKAVALGTPTGSTTWADDVTGQAGDIASYRMVATNEGPSPLDAAFPATLTDPLTAIPYANPATVTWTANATGGAQVWNSATSAWVTTLTGTGPLTGASALRWHSPDRTTTPTAAVTVVVTGTTSVTAAAGTYPNTATVAVSTAGGPQETNLANNTDNASLRLIDGDTWRVAKTADPVTGATVTGGSEITYTVTASADDVAGRGDVRGVVLTDDLSDVLDDASFVTGSARLTIDSGTPTTVADPVGTTLTTAPFTLPHGATATLTYRVLVDTDVPGGTRLRNVVTGDATTGDPETCAPPADPDDETCATVHTTPAWSLAKTVADADAPGTTLPDGSLVQPGTTLVYSVTATNAGLADVDATLVDDLSDLLEDPTGPAGPKATFVNGSVTLDVDGTPAAGSLPTAPDANHLLEVGPVTLPAASTAGGTTTPTTAVLTYRVTVADDAWATTLRNAVTGTGTDPVGGGELPPLTCTPDDPCTTDQRTPLLLQVEKRGEDLNGDVVPMDGSQWAIYSDADLTPEGVVAPPLAPVPGKVGLFRTQLEPGRYWLVETRALDGFQLLPTPVEFTVEANGTVNLVNPTSYLSVRNNMADDHAWTVVVQDIPMLDLPEAGGRSPAGLIAAGVLFTLLAGALAVRTRRTTTGRP